MIKISRRQFRSWLMIRLRNFAHALEAGRGQVDAYKDKDFIDRLEKILKEAKSKYKNLHG